MSLLAERHPRTVSEGGSPETSSQRVLADAAKPKTTKAAWRNRIVGSGEVAPSELIPNARNWRTHPKRQLDALEGALRGYNEINLRAMKLLAPGGMLVTCSCSYHVDAPTFLEMLRSAAADARREFRLVELRTQAADHPILLAAKETQYLKCAILEAVN